MTHASLERRIAELERGQTRTRVFVAAGVLALLVILAMGAQQTKPPPAEPDHIKTRRISILDDEGKVRIELGQDRKDTHRRSRAAGITIFDSKGDERGGIGTMDDGSAVIALDAPQGVGSPMRDRVGMMVKPDGSCLVLLLDNDSHPVAALQSDGKGGGMQVFKYDAAKKKMHVKTIKFDGEETAVEDMGG